MNILVLPVSGGSFPVQLGILSDLVTTIERPKITLASSGGGVTAYTVLAADWSPEGIERVARLLHTGILIKSWWPYPFHSVFPSWILGYFKGSMYQSSDEVIKFFSDHFNKETITKDEIWIGTVNTKQSKASFFCNKSSEESIVKRHHFNTKILGCLHPTYLEGNVNKIATSTLASASIPILVSAQEIDGECYVDGGLFCASPLTVMKDIIHQLVLEAEDVKCSQDNSQDKPQDISGSLHIDYVNSFDVELTKQQESLGNLLNVTKGLYQDFVRSYCVNDRLAAISLLRYNNEKVRYTECEGSLENLIKIQSLRKKACRSLVEYYPTKLFEMPIDSFTGNDVVKMIQDVRKAYRCRIWWTGPASFSELGKEEILFNGTECTGKCSRKDESLDPEFK